MLTQAPKISVVIPLYNKRAHIIRTVKSVLNQTLSAMEIIVVDDGSTDNGGEHLLAVHSRDVRYIAQENQGVSQARNRGIRAAKGDFIAFLDADDTWEPHFLEEIHLMIQAFPQASVFATAYQFQINDNQFIDPKIRTKRSIKGQRILKNYFEIAAKGDLPFMMSSVCFRASEFNVLGMFPENEPMGEDQDLFARAAIRSKIAYSPRVLSFYHLDAENRACNSNVPFEECPFSRRVHHWATEFENNKNAREAMIDYTAAHLLHIASLNVKQKNVNAAKHLLSDSRCRRNLVRYFWWNLRCSLIRFSVPSLTA